MHVVGHRPKSEYTDATTFHAHANHTYRAGFTLTRLKVIGDLAQRADSISPAFTLEQGRKLGEFVRAGELRERNAALVQGKAREAAQPEYVAASRIMHERTGGDSALAAESIIDQELGL